jgi:hypothetical protein
VWDISKKAINLAYKISNMGRIGRNEPCHCGSGEKYKDCHLQMGEQKGTSKAKLIIRVLVAIGILIIVIGMFLNIQTSGNQAPGKAPEGKVWSPEHGHWHDAE